MNSRTRLACGVAIGYLLGRTRKMRLALMIAGATGAAGSPRQLVARGVKQLASVPEVGKLTTIAKGQFVDAAKTAAMTAASSRIDALTERLQGHADSDEDTHADDRADTRADDDTRTDDEDTRADDARHRDESSDETGDESRDETGEEPAEDTEESGGDEAARPRRRASGTARRRASADLDDKPRRSGTRRSSRSPVRRAGK